MALAPRPVDLPAQPGRRLFLGGGLGLLAAALTGCRVRWEDDAPEIPFIPIPTREPIPAEDALLWLLRDSHDLAMTGEPDEAVYAEQTAVLRTALYRAGVPIETIEAALATPVARPPAPTVTAPAFTAVPRPDPESTRTPAGATAGETDTTLDIADPAPTEPAEPPRPVAPRDGPAAALRRLRDLAGCGAGLFPIIVSLLAQRWAAVHRGGYDVPGASAASRPVGPWPSPDEAVPFAALTDPARYGFEVIAAQSREEVRITATSTLALIRSLFRAQDARSGGSAAVPEIGYPLPFAVNSPQTAAALASEILADLVDGYAVLAADLAGPSQRTTLPDLVGWLGTAAALGAEWGVPVTAFPGLSTAASAGEPPKTPASTRAPLSTDVPSSSTAPEPTASP